MHDPNELSENDLESSDLKYKFYQYEHMEGFRMNQMLKVFEYENKQVRTVVKNNDIEFVAKDLCEIVDLGDVSKSVSRLDEDEKGTNLILTPGGYQEMLCVTESGFYSLILSSRKPEAKAFKRWVTHDVLPSIRKQGFYINEKHPNVFKTLKSMLGIETANKLELINEASLQVKHGFGFHDPDYICQFEAKEEYDMPYTKFISALRKRNLIEWEYEPYEGTYWKTKQRICKPVPTEQAEKESLVQVAKNCHLRSFKNADSTAYCVRVLKSCIGWD